MKKNYCLKYDLTDDEVQRYFTALKSAYET